ncbi:hypothetical protein A5712_21625 [Mycobacterium sp. E2327]|uniref:cytochrome P450 n=1 Tax=Mycobacterium sp. E2327 TaxID=1834132 RepID=UPI0007FDD786|nr:cytochrome P450 [Mycobacterium sp. E2327]OBI18592.1 hypothetical protein A5712_21625 [Mycobacterium sp. E2327]
MKAWPYELVFTDRAAAWQQVRRAGRSVLLDAHPNSPTQGEKLLVLSTAADVAAALRNHDLRAFTGWRYEEPVAFLDSARRVLRRAITAGAPAWVEQFRGPTAALIDAAAESAGCDAMEVAWPLAGHLFSAMNDVQLANCPGGELPLPDLIRRARANPGDDLVSRILNEAPQLSDRELRLLVLAAWLGAQVGIPQILGFTLLHLARNPWLQRQLRENPDERIDHLIEEIVRLEPTAPAPRQYAARDTEINGLAVPKGTQVSICLAAADREGEGRNHVSHQWSKSRKHFGFSGGRWLCPGIHVARGALRVAIEEWLRTVPEFTVAPGFTPRLWGAGVAFGSFALRELPLRWKAV